MLIGGAFFDMNNENLIIRPKHLRGEDGYRVFSVRIKTDILDRLDEIAAQTGRSRNELVRLFLEYALDHCVVEETDG